MDKETFKRLMDKREVEARQSSFRAMMELSGCEEYLRMSGHYSRFMHLGGREAFCLDHSIRQGAWIRKQEEDDILLCYRKLTPDGDLIHIPTAEEIATVDMMIAELGL